MASEVLVALGAIALTLLLLYLFYGVVHRAFRAVGFSSGEASLVLLGSFLGSAIDIPLFPYNGWFVFVNVGGAIVPLVVTWLLLRRQPSMIGEALVGTAFVAIATYFVATPTPEGIVSPFPLWLIPAGVAAAVSLLAFWQERGYAAPLAYVSGTLGAIVGGDALHVFDFLAQTPPENGGFASIGGAAVFDMIFLTGILAVSMDALLFHLRRRDHEAERLPYREPLVFTPATPPEIIAGYDPSADVTMFPPQGTARAARAAEAARKAQQKAASTAQARPGATEAPGWPKPPGGAPPPWR